MAVRGIGIPERSIRFGDCELNASSFELRRGRRGEDLFGLVLYEGLAECLRGIQPIDVTWQDHAAGASAVDGRVVNAGR